MLKKPEISIIICTHNRAQILHESLLKYRSLREINQIEILVVLNQCTDNSLEITESHAKELPQLRWVEEPKIGHSNARNKGMYEASAEFVFYIDDDAYPDVNLVVKLLDHLKTHNIKCISGRTLFWNQDAAPWIKNEMVETPEFRSNFGLMPKGGYINGCACGFHKTTLESLGGFAKDLGMSGKELGYYDEVFVQHKLEDSEIPIYFDPSLLVFHRSHQSTVLEFLTASFVKGKSLNRYLKKYGDKKQSTLSLLLKLPLVVIEALISLPRNVFRHGLQAGLVIGFNGLSYYLGRLTS